MKYYLLYLFFSALVCQCCAQSAGDTVIRRNDTGRTVQAPATDTVKRRDSTTAAKNNTGILMPAPAVRRAVTQKAREGYVKLLLPHPYYNFFGTPRAEITAARRDSNNEGLFYLFIAIVLYYALFRLAFSKYLHNLYTVFFRVSLKQKQIREQLMQNPLPSLLLNIFFIISGGVFVTLLLRYYHYLQFLNVWYLILYSTIAIAAIYLVKFMVLKLMGWMFHIREATDTYIFAVFMVNKIIGILLIPLVILLAYSGPVLVPVFVTIAFSLIIFLFIYRYIVAFAPVRKEIKVSQLHFILYLCAFEIIPLLLIYKVLVTFLRSLI